MEIWYFRDHSDVGEVHVLCFHTHIHCVCEHNSKIRGIYDELYLLKVVLRVHTSLVIMYDTISIVHICTW